VRPSSAVLVCMHNDLNKIRLLAIQFGCQPLVSEKSHDCILQMLRLLLAVRACCVHLQQVHEAQSAM